MKKETGFASYRDYLSAYAKDGNPSEILGEYHNIPYDVDPKPDCSIIDLSRDFDSNLSSSLLDYDGSIENSAISLLKDLRHPPSNSVCRILLWWLVPDSGYPIEICQILGLTLRISPQFFIALFEGSGLGNWDLSYANITGQTLGSSSASYTISGQHVSMIARNYLPQQVAAPPVVLIVGYDKSCGRRYNNSDTMGSMSRKRMVSRRWEERSLYDSPPFHETDTADGELYLERMSSESIHQGTREYLKALDLSLGLKSNTHVPDEDIAGLCLMPLMSLEAMYLQSQSRLLEVQTLLDIDDREGSERSSEVYRKLQEQRSQIRRYIGISEAGQRGFTRYL